MSGATAPRACVRRFRARGRVVVADDSPSHGFELGGLRPSIDLSRCAPWSTASASVNRWLAPCRITLAFFLDIKTYGFAAGRYSLRESISHNLFNRSHGGAAVKLILWISSAAIHVA